MCPGISIFRSSSSKSDSIPGEAARLYVAFTNYHANSIVVINEEAYLYQNVTQCSLYNASCDADFTYRNSELSVYISDISFKNYVDGSGGLTIEAPHVSIMSALGDLLVGSVTESPQYTKIDLLPSITNDTVEPAVEELFQNMTLSVLTNSNSRFTSVR